MAFEPAAGAPFSCITSRFAAETQDGPRGGVNTMATTNSGRFKKGDPQTREAGRKGGQASGQTRAAKSTKSRGTR